MTLQIKPLAGPSRLEELFHLRVTAWEHSDKGAVINHQLFPNGWYDELDEGALHWIVTNEEEKIIASARLNIFNTLESFPYYSSLQSLDIPRQAPLGLFGRLVVHPDYQGLSLTTKLLVARMEYCKANHIQWGSAFVTRDCVKKVLYKAGFDAVGYIDVNYHENTQPHSVQVFVRQFYDNKGYPVSHGDNPFEVQNVQVVSVQERGDI